MAESASDRLKRQIRERKEAAALAAVTEGTNHTATLPEPTPVQEVAVVTEPEPAPAPELPEPTELATLSEPVVLQKSSRNHPLVREMEELEAALEQNVPGFVTLLRDIHKKLAEDPLTVTLLSLEERGTIVKGMTRHANVTITTKAIKSSSSKRKTPVTAADL
jgi:hypothetical protein